jgi:hypothetical protein
MSILACDRDPIALGVIVVESGGASGSSSA